MVFLRRLYHAGLGTGARVTMVTAVVKVMCGAVCLVRVELLLVARIHLIKVIPLIDGGTIITVGTL